ncbi:uncharacterized protein LOC100832629 [Brachypodium distachyon]|uniref:Uncharacterized protein n=1 Tax=Brachypodium distachyon TaxID=15368 RepID=I1HTH4_BRADI|nr:uncharacterized protein LOC100832629 [Brachypodium distachyon]KQK10632.1 hypothetical protein BRADI_2g55260v3 [Brachypodium distachyon]|eukprot:XP_003564638.1 uncharacterized protein LOC100832629 [Brachypodium distachyon]
MRRKGSECTRISPEIATSGNPMISLQTSRSARSAQTSSSSDRDRPAQARGGGCRLLRSARWSAASCYRRARVSVAMAFWSSAPTKKGPSSAASRSLECTPARSSSMRHSATLVVADESHKSEAVEECIRFMNSSSRKYR